MSTRPVYRTMRVVAEDVLKRVDAYQDGTLRPLYTSSAKEMELLTGIFPGDLLVLAAASGMGKTARLIAWLLNFCNGRINPDMHKKVRIKFDSWEMEDVAVALRITAAMMYKKTKQLLTYKSLTPDDRIALAKTLAILSDLEIDICQIPQDIAMYKDICEEQCESAVEDGVQLVKAMDHTRMARQSKHQTTEERKITDFMESQVVLKKHPALPIFIDLSQMNREYEKRFTEYERGKNMPIKSDIFGSDAVFQCADLVCVGHRPGYYDVATFGEQNIDTGITSGDGRDTLWVEGWLKQREGDSGKEIYMRHRIEHLKFKDA